eukprot:GHVR01091396.1.p1 GENE.GHVR01091396.1~~GHVR01091396.1.p1  ORF type:complete len:133 (+),score=0.71 GHVR01091396.1:115-513(+)
MSSKVLTAGNIKFLIAACSYIVVSITTVVFHKQLFKSKYSFPVFLTGFQQCVGLVILIIMGEIGRITKNDNIRSIFPPVRVEKRGFLMVYYCAIFFVSYLSIANIELPLYCKYVSERSACYYLSIRIQRRKY